jgi:T5orf172 domain
MVALSGQRTQFTWALNEYNKSDDPSVRARFVRHMAASIRNAMAGGFSRDEITRGKSYPADEVTGALSVPDVALEADVSEAQAKETLHNSVDSTDARRKGTGAGSVYAYGYRCAPDRMKIGYTEGDTIERIAAQIGTSTPDKPVLLFEVRTDRSRALERALHAILVYRGKKIRGGGDEWFVTSVDEIERG